MHRRLDGQEVLRLSWRSDSQIVHRFDEGSLVGILMDICQLPHANNFNTDQL